MRDRINKIIKLHWEQMIRDFHFYRGMSLKNLDLKSDIVLDSKVNPLEGMIPLFIEYSELLSKLIKEGLEFNVKDFYVEPLSKILNWTIRDIKNPGIDFTTNYADAASYAFNYEGSQIKHNFNLIANTIHECKNQKCFDKIDAKKFWELTEKIKLLLKNDNIAKHQPVVVKVKKSCASFENEKVKELNFGSFDFFFDRVKKEAIQSNAFSINKITFFLHQISQSNDFNIRLIKPLYKNDIEETIEL